MNFPQMKTLTTIQQEEEPKLNLPGNPFDYICRGCESPIDVDKAHLSIGSNQGQSWFWHPSCLSCDICKFNLQWETSCFVHKGKTLCTADYRRISTCPGCNQKLVDSDLVFRVAPNISYHFDCLSCYDCGEALRYGDAYYIAGRQVLCLRHGANPDFDVQLQPFAIPVNNSVQKTLSSPSNSPSDSQLELLHNPKPIDVFNCRKNRKTKQNERKSSKKTQFRMRFFRLSSISAARGDAAKLCDDEMEEILTVQASPLRENDENLQNMTPMGPGRQRMSTKGGKMRPNNGVNTQKRIRTSFKHEQLRVMKSYFKVNQNPDSKDLRQLSTQTDLPKRVLQVWFQNARAKYRRWGSNAESLSTGLLLNNVDQIEPSVSYITDNEIMMNQEPPRNQAFAPIKDLLQKSPVDTPLLEDVFPGARIEITSSHFPTWSDITGVLASNDFGADIQQVNLASIKLSPT